MARLLVYRWPKHVGATTIVSTIVGALALVALALFLTDRPPMCGAVVMQAEDQCVINGSVVSYSDIANSPLPSVVFAAAAGLVGWLVLHMRRKNKPTRAEVVRFEKYAAARRQELLADYDSSPEHRRKWATPEALSAAFDKKLERQRKRKHYHVNPTTNAAAERGPLPDLPG